MKYFKLSSVYLGTLFKWIPISVLVGIVCGSAGILFCLALGIIEKLFSDNGMLIFLLPFLGFVIVWIYKTSNMAEHKGTNGIFETVRNGQKVSVFLAPIIFVATALTHLGGGSAGREGAALQMGGSLGAFLGKLLDLSPNDLKTITVCGMSATFCGLFGTPLTAALFCLEVIHVGIFNYSSLVPCITSSLTAFSILKGFNISTDFMKISGAPESFMLNNTVSVFILAALSAGVSIIWCISIDKSAKFLKKTFKNPYIRILVSSCSIICLTFLVNTHDYNGTGMKLAGRAIAGEKLFLFAFLLKMLFTCITLEGGFRGGEIVPTFCIGATFGSVAAPFLGLNSGFGAAIGMIAVFCGAVNCPISSLILSIELFGSDHLLYFAVATAVSYMISGRCSLYSSQKLVFSKLEPILMENCETSKHLRQVQNK